jgi:uncharacterized YigZ family protein
METPHKYRTIAATGTSDFRDRGSKFLGYAYPIASAAEVKEKVQALKKVHPKANHHCLAWRAGTDGTQYRAADDGEPAGSAGRPILGQIDSLGLTSVLIVVVRYFGGTLLGVPGLITAYKTAATAALEGLPVVEKWVEAPVEVTFDYARMGEVRHLLKQFEATIHRQELQLFCSISTGIPKHQLNACLAKLSEIRGVEAKPG